MRRVALCAALISLSACAPGSRELKVPEYQPEGQTKARSATSSLKPLVLEWPAADRAALEAHLPRGVAVVRYGQGEMELLPRCHASTAYRFQALTPKTESLLIRDDDELTAAMPIHTASLAGRLAKRESLAVKMTVVGVYDSEPRTWASKDLRGECARATHVITALTVGAFDIAASASQSSSAKASALGASAGASRDAHREELRRDGRHDACGGKRAPGGAPPDCGALLRVELAPIKVPVATGACAPGDATCMSARAQGGCQAGFVRKGQVCEAVDPQRPSLVEGLGGR